AALHVDSKGADFDIAFEATTGGPLCNVDCPSANIDAPSMLAPANPMFVSGAGSTRAELTPRSGSPLVDSGVDWVDRNGRKPRRFDGVAPDRGAVERP